MSIGTSEQLLKALEHSKEDPNELLDQAASIIGYRFDEDQTSHNDKVQDQNESRRTFKEQWVLKWTVRKLNETTSGKQIEHDAKHKFVTNIKTWSLLIHLIAIIPKQKSIEILIERDFTNILTHASPFLLEEDRQRISAQSQDSTCELDSDRPRKRVRLSPKPDESLGDSNALRLKSRNTPLSTFIDLINVLGNLLQPTTRPSSRAITPAWANSVTEAAKFIGSFLEAVQQLLKSFITVRVNDAELVVAQQWLRLWRGFVSSNNTVDRAIICKIFNEICLNGCLGLYALVHDTNSMIRLDAVSKEIEKCIALYTISPLRSSFTTKHSSAWKDDRLNFTWKDLEPVLETFTEELSGALMKGDVGNLNVVLLRDPAWASFLISIASRLIPREDVRARRKAASWLEAATLCLAYLAFPKDLPKMKSEDGMAFYPDYDELSPAYGSVQNSPSLFLDTIRHEEIQYSTPVKVYLIASILAWRNQPLPLSCFSAIIQVAADVFERGATDKNSSSCLQYLSDDLAIQPDLDETEYNKVVQEVIILIFNAFVKARNFHGLFDMWFSNLEEALRLRAKTTPASGKTPCAWAWADEDVFMHFTSLCDQHNQTSFSRDLLQGLVIELQEMPRRVGSTLDIFARLAIVESALKAMDEDFFNGEECSKLLGSLADLVVNAIQQPTDYQGQRWRLWSTLTTLEKLDARLARFNSIMDAMEASCKQFRSRQETLGQEHSQRCGLLAEQYTVFCLLVQHFSLTSDRESDMGKKLHSLLKTEIKSLAKMIDTIDKSSISLLWSGRTSDLRDLKQLIEGCLGCLVQQIGPHNNDGALWTKLLQPVTVKLQQHNSTPTSLAGKTFLDLATSFLAESLTGEHDLARHQTDSTQAGKHLRMNQTTTTSEAERLSQYQVDKLLVDAQMSLAGNDRAQELKWLKSQTDSQSNDMSAMILTSMLIREVNEDDLRADKRLTESLISKTIVGHNTSAASLSYFLVRLDLVTFTLKAQPGVVNQATIDMLLRDLAIISSASFKANAELSLTSQSSSGHDTSNVFDRLIVIVEVLLSRYRRRLTGRTHLLLPVFQNLLKCFFYTPSRAYIYQSPATAKQKQAFRSSLPCWLTKEPLSASSAVGFSRIVSSICNPTTASARSAHHKKRRNGPNSLELNDETKKARKIAAQYMQYLIMEYARSSLDGVIQAEVRERLTPGLYSILDAMDKDLMKAMNAAMDPSSRAIFKGLYGDWIKHWKWNQN